MPKQLNNGKVTEALQRAFGFKGRYQPMLDEVIVPVYQISDPVPADEQRLCNGAIYQDPNITTNRSVGPEFINPEESGVLCSVTSVLIGSFKSGAGPPNVVRYDVRFDTAADQVLPGIDTIRNDGNFRDQREATPLPRDRVPACFLLSNNARSSAYDLDTIFAFTTVIADVQLTEMVGAVGAQPRQPVVVLQPGRMFSVRAADSSDAGGAGSFSFGMVVSWLETPIQQQPAS